MSYAVENHATSGNHIRLAPGTLINNCYEVLGEAGSGNFARVFECRDVRNGARIAVKLMKPGYERDADFEEEVLNVVAKNDASDTCGIVRLVEKLRWNNYTGLAFTLKGKALRAVRLPMARSEVAQVGKDVATALHFLHFKCRAVHTDLKPENILQEIDSSKPAKWVLCDFGSASFYSAVQDNDLITTRPYRAPEVVMKRGWNYNADAWSLGCILYELCTGRKLFDAQTDGEHLEVMQSRLGPMPQSMCPPRALASGGRRGVRTLKEELSHEPQLLQVVEKLLQFDPNSRPRCGDILSMPFFGGAAAPSAAPSVRSLSGAAYAAAPSAAASTGTYRMPQSAAAPLGAENRGSGIYATHTNVVRRDAGLASSQPKQLQPMSLAAANNLRNAALPKSSYGGLAASSMYRLNQQQGAENHYAAPSSRSNPSTLPHPSQFPRPTEVGAGAAGLGSGRGIMSPAMPNYIR